MEDGNTAALRQHELEQDRAERRARLIDSDATLMIGVGSTLERLFRRHEPDIWDDMAELLWSAVHCQRHDVDRACSRLAAEFLELARRELVEEQNEERS